jgi:hypothetical protein
MKKIPPPHQPCGFRQLCAIAKALLAQRPMLLHDSVEWKESIKDLATSLGYPSPMTADVYKAMNAVEHVHRRRSASS